MRRNIIIIICSAIAGLLHIGLFQSMSEIPIFYFPIALCTLLLCMHKRTEAMISAITSGFFIDLFSDKPFGTTIIMLLVLAFGIDLLFTSIFSQRSWYSIFFVVLVATLVIIGVEKALLAFTILGKSLAGPDMNWHVMQGALFSSIVTSILTVLLLQLITLGPRYRLKPYIVG